MDDQDLRDLKDSVKTINAELGALWRELAKVGNDVCWVKDIVWKGLAPVLVGIVVLLIGILLKLLLG